MARTAVALLTAAVLLACAGCGAGAAAPASPPSARSTPAPEQPTAEPRSGTPYAMLQMNLCLSGLAGCFAPEVVDEAVRTIRADHPPRAVSLNEVCSRDAADIARRTGLHVRFTAVKYRGALLPCVKPGGRGLFGNAVLTEERIVASEDQAFAAQFGLEERRWICVTTSRDVNVCSAHLGATAGPDRQRANAEQCAELATLLTGYAEKGPTIFAGDVNRRKSCAPDGYWVSTDIDADAEAGQAPGIQHVYGSGAFSSPRGTVVPAAHTDHDYLRVDTRLAPRARAEESD